MFSNDPTLNPDKAIPLAERSLAEDGDYPGTKDGPAPFQAEEQAASLICLTWFENYCRLKGQFIADDETGRKISRKRFANNVQDIYDHGLNMPNRRKIKDILNSDFDRIAKGLGCEIPEVEGDKIWAFIGKLANEKKPTLTKYSSGETDPQKDSLNAFIDQFNLAVKMKNITNMSILEPFNYDLCCRFGIAIALTYMTVVPPENPENDEAVAMRSENGDRLRECWNYIRSHPHYMSTTSHKINLHCFDEIEKSYPEFIYDPCQIFNLRHTICRGASAKTEDLWFAFRYITEILHPKGALWDPVRTTYSRIWGITL